MIRAIVVLAVLSGLAPAQHDERSLDQWLEYLRPGESEAAWRAIPWRDEFGAAAIEAREAKKPLLVWAMNGHPLGCT